MKKLLFIGLSVWLIGLGIGVYADNSGEASRLPGTSIASLKLQMDTLLPVYVITTQKSGGCRTNKFTVLDTKVTRKPTYRVEGEYAYADGPWNELWTVSSCGYTYTVPIKFIPNKTTGGTTYSISEKNIKLKQ